MDMRSNYSNSCGPFVINNTPSRTWEKMEQQDYISRRFYISITLLRIIPQPPSREDKKIFLSTIIIACCCVCSICIRRIETTHNGESKTMDPFAPAQVVAYVVPEDYE